MSNSFYHNKVVVITGGSSGIGLAVAKEFARRYARITIISRDIEKLKVAQSAIQKINGEIVVDIIAADVSLKEQITAAIDAVGIKSGTIDVLINCAGIAAHGRFADLTNEQFEKTLQVNYMGVVYASKAAWKYLKAAKGQLSFVSSVAGYLGLIGYSNYAPTKFAITGLAECLFYEGRDDNIRVSIIYPPDTDTPLLHNERQNTLPECLALSKNIEVKTPEEVAMIYIRGLQKNRFEIYCDFNSRLIRSFKNNLPKVFALAKDMVIKKSRKSL
jgi:3-dehydrosphinganine reductase